MLHFIWLCFKGIFRLLVKLSRRSRDFLLTPSPHSHSLPAQWYVCYKWWPSIDPSLSVHYILKHLNMLSTHIICVVIWVCWFVHGFLRPSWADRYQKHRWSPSGSSISGSIRGWGRSAVTERGHAGSPHRAALPQRIDHQKDHPPMVKVTVHQKKRTIWNLYTFSFT